MVRCLIGAADGNHIWQQVAGRIESHAGCQSIIVQAIVAGPSNLQCKGKRAGANACGWSGDGWSAVV